jgi:uncharacterized membrane protein
MSASPPPTDQDIVDRIGLLLRVGVIASAVVLLVGGVLYLMRHGNEPAPDRSTFAPPEFSRPRQAVEAALAGRGRGIIQVGILLLIATPVLRVVYSIFAFARRRDVVYVLFPLLVLLVLLVGFLVEPARR